MFSNSEPRGGANRRPIAAEKATVADCYRGRIAPTPSGYLHLGHARTFWTAQQRARDRGGALILRVEDLDPDRCRAEFADALLEDLRWFGFDWQEGPDVGGPFGPYRQSERLAWFREVWRRLLDSGAIYPSPHSRRDIAQALVAPHDDPPAPSNSARRAAADEAVFPAELRPRAWQAQPGMEADPELVAAMRSRVAAAAEFARQHDPAAVNWRFRVPDGETIAFDDGRHGRAPRVAGVDFGDFLVWRRDGLPAYELAVVADDHAMRISEVVRGDDLLTSTARQLLIYRALGWQAPSFYHCPLLRDAAGQRLAKRTDAVSLRSRRAAGESPQDLRGGSDWLGESV